MDKNVARPLVDNASDVPLVGVSVGASDPENPENAEAYRALIDVTFAENIRSRMTWFHVRGGLDYPRMSWAHGTIMRVVSWNAKRQAATGDEESRQMYESFGEVIDFRNRASLAPVVDYVRALVPDAAAERWLTRQGPRENACPARSPDVWTPQRVTRCTPPGTGRSGRAGTGRSLSATPVP